MRRVRSLSTSSRAAVTAVLAGALLLACGNNPYADNQTLFEALTANRWCNKTQIANDTDGLADTRQGYAFKADGTYSWSHESDHPEGKGSGNWNWRLATPSSGLILLSEGDALSFSLDPKKKLALETMQLEVCNTLDQAKGKTAKSLPHIDTSDLFDRLTGNTWENTSEINAYRVPARLKFEPDGEYEAVIGDGDCTFRGTWSLRDSQLIRSVQPGACGLASGSNAHFYRFAVEIKGALTLIESALYAPQPRDRSTSTAYLRLGELEGLIRYEGSLQPGKLTKLDITIMNRGKTDATLTSFSVTGEPLLRTSDGYTSNGARRELVSQELANRLLPPGQSHAFTIQVTLESAPQSKLTFDVQYTVAQIRSNPPVVARDGATSFIVDSQR